MVVNFSGIRFVIYSVDQALRPPMDKWDMESIEVIPSVLFPVPIQSPAFAFSWSIAQLIEWVAFQLLQPRLAEGVPVRFAFLSQSNKG